MVTDSAWIAVATHIVTASKLPILRFDPFFGLNTFKLNDRVVRRAVFHLKLPNDRFEPKADYQISDLSSWLKNQTVVDEL